jgi:hypothetical protein
VVVLVIADRFEPPLLRSLEESRYENPAKDFRFENSDLFGLGPLIEYFRDHPRGRLRRVLFLGNSVMYGYGLTAAETLPAHYQRLDPFAKVFNVAVNGFDAGTSFLVAKAAIDAVDLVYVLLRHVDNAFPVLPNLIPIEEADLARFHLAAPDQTERLLAQVVNHWRLYRDAYRLQAALFGTSTREYIYLNKGVLARALVARLRAAQSSSVAADETATTESPMSDALPDGRREAQLRAESPALWRFGDLSAGRRRLVVLLHVPDYSEPLTDDAIGDFNRVFAPYARVLVLHIPRPLTYDGEHFTSEGATRVARALWNGRPDDHPR